MVAPVTSSDTRFRLDAAQAQTLAETYGTPLYVVDEEHFRTTVRQYREAFANAYQPSEITYASKANSTVALIKIAYEEGCAIDVASEGELRAALRADVPAAKCHLHGNNKLRSELEFAIEAGIGSIIVDHFGELETLAELLAGKTQPALVLRLAPGVDPVTHAKISTGQADTKFGFNITDGSASKAVDRMLALGLNLVGFHCHVGSQLLDPEAQRSGGSLIAKFALDTFERTGFQAKYLNVGGGLGVRYTSGDQPMPVGEYCRLVVQALREELPGWPRDLVLAQEPGRSLVAESGVTLYEVGVVKSVPAPGRGTRTYVCVDGGLSDNPRPVMYGSKYTVLPVEPSDDLATVTVSGRHCETDKLFEDIQLPSSLRAGDLIQVLCTGAYNSGMASNYNRFLRPAMALIQPDGSSRLIQRRETWDDLFARETF
jgi:diaminopimelate decarboxylase